MTYPCCRFYIRIFAPLLATVLAVAVALAGFTNDKLSEVEAAPTAQSEPLPPRRLRPAPVSPGNSAGFNPAAGSRRGPGHRYRQRRQD